MTVGHQINIRKVKFADEVNACEHCECILLECVSTETLTSGLYQCVCRKCVPGG